jgi:hypothetical protein
MSSSLQNFPPFYTRQINDQVRQHQITAWHTLILNAMSTSQKYLLTVSGALQQEPFINKHLARQLDRSFLVEILNHIVQRGDGLWVKEGESCLVYWRRPREIGQELLKTFEPGYLCTVWEVLRAPEWKGKAFWGIEPEMMQQVLQVMQAEGQVKVIQAPSALECGIKFI